jgi:hypothetical protein
MTNRFMISVAAVTLIAGTGLANAQGTGMGREGSSGGSTVQQSAPSTGSAGGINRESTEQAKPSDTKSSTGMKATEEKMAPGGSKTMKGEKSAQDNNMQKSKGMSSENDNARDNGNGGARDMKAESRENRNGNETAQTKGAESRSETTTGQAGAGAKLSSEQRTRITTVIRDQHVAPLANVNFSIAVGSRIPREGVSFHPLPTEVVTVYPQWRGYEFILVRDQIVVIDPRTFEIVAILET